MKKRFTHVLMLLVCVLSAVGQQLPNSDFEDWSGPAFDGNAQPAYWKGSNVEQLGFRFTFLERKEGHTGNSSAYVFDQEVGAFGITETGPGYMGLGTSWQYLSGINTGTATAGMYGGIDFSHRPDSMSVWIKRTGPRVMDEDFYLIYYSWSGTSKARKYTNKNNGCQDVGKDIEDEESDIRQAVDGNVCGTTQKATQVAEGMWRERHEYGEWTNIRVPIYYMNGEVPEKCNVIFSAGNYPNFRANSGLYDGNCLYIDDVELIYTSKIDVLMVDGREWRGFDPNSSEEQTYSLGEKATTMPTLQAIRGRGTITNAHGTTVTFPGRVLSGSEIEIVEGQIGGAPTVITVKSANAATRVYKIKFVREASTNSRLASIKVNGQEISGFNAYTTNYTVDLPYGTTAVPVVEAVGQEDEQTIQVTQANSVTGKATIVVTAADQKAKTTYTVQFGVAKLADNTLQDILVNGTSIPGFTPNQTIYRVSLPTTTTEMPTVKGISKYPEGEQTITYTKPDKIDGGTYQVSVTTPGNQTPKTYKLTFKLEASTYSRLKDLQMGGYITNFDPEVLTYQVHLPMGTTELPEVTYVLGDPGQTVTVEKGGLDGTTKVIVRPASDKDEDQTIYKIVVSTEKSEVSVLNMIYVGGEPLAGFEANKTNYTYELPIGTTTLPEITVDKADEYQDVRIVTGGVNGTTRITVTAGNGATTIYQIAFSVMQATNATLNMIYLDGEPLTGFSPDVLEYWVVLPMGTTELPVVTYDQHDEYQIVTTRSKGVNGDYTLTVRPQSGASQTYTIHFSVEVSDNVDLAMIYLDGTPLADFSAAQTNYEVTLPAGTSTLPTVTYDKGEASQTVTMVWEDTQVSLMVRSESGSKRTYTILFVIPRSENAKLNMIYLDGTPLAGFDPDVLSYEVQLTQATCPVITVDKENGQQVTIAAPYGAGTATIRVQPEMGSANTYVIEFVALKEVNEDVQLNMIYVDGEAIAGYNPSQTEYDVTCGETTPVVTYDAKPGQVVQVLNGEGVVYVNVAANGKTALYTIHLNRVQSDNAMLAAILADGVMIEGFTAEQTDYTLHLPAGSMLPTITYVAGDSKQVVNMGQTSLNDRQIVVTAENGNQRVYTVHIDVALYDDSSLVDLIVDGYDIGYEPNTLEYHLTMDEGTQMPNVTYVARPFQTILQMNMCDTIQKVCVAAQSGIARTYTIIYERVKSDNSQLADILVNGVSMSGFSPDTYHYVDSLNRHAQVVPTVFPVAAIASQTITTYYSAPDGVTRIHVQSQNHQSETTYEIAFPVRKSGNNKLATLLFDEIDFAFNPDQTEYDIVLARGATKVPEYMYEKGDDDQYINVISRPLGETTEIHVRAENGAERVYKLNIHADFPTEANRLRSLTIRESGVALDVTNYSQTVRLPYGTRDMQIDYEKMYDEQTVLVQPGSIYRPTIITVRANRADETDVVYTLTPEVETQNPAILTELKVNGVSVENFDPNRFSYIVPVTERPVIGYTLAQGASINVLVQTSKHWQAEVTCADRTNVYDVWYYYTNEVVPNADFTDWSACATLTTAQKPTGWNTIADVLGTHSGFGSFTPNQLCVKDGDDAVHLSSRYSSPGGGTIPGFITLGTVTGRWGVAGSSSFAINGGVTFHNSPDVMQIRYYQSKVKTNTLIQYTLTGSDGTETLTWEDSETSSEYVVKDFDLSAANTSAGDPSMLNIVLDSYYSISGTTGNVGSSSVSDMYIDWIRFAYNSKLAGLKVNGIEATKTGNVFEVTLTDSENLNVPELTFVGEVADQAQVITWTDEDADGQRTASIRNYAEDGTYTDYVLHVHRPVDTRNELADILVGGVSLADFESTKLQYEIHRASTVHHLPDVTCVAQSTLQDVQMSMIDNTLHIVVKPEQGESREYEIAFVQDLSDDVTLENISGIDGFTPEQKTYTVTAAKMPDLNFVKKMDGQTVVMNDGLFTVTAENGNVGTYTITLQAPTLTTSGLLSEVELNGNVMSDFSPTTFEYTKEQPTWASFTRQYVQDSVVFVQSSTGLEWQVYGTENHVYHINYPTILSSNTALAGIYVGGELVDGFNPQIYDYTVVSDTAPHIKVLPAELEQTLVVSRDRNVLKVIVTSADKMHTATYTLTLVLYKSDDSRLSDILLDGESLVGFAPDVLTYVVTLPTSDVKLAEPKMPNLTYLTANPGAVVELTSATKLGETSFISVTSEDGQRYTEYEVLIAAEPSHNTDLTGILVDGNPIEHFESTHYFYTVAAASNHPSIQWSADDRFQTVTKTEEGSMVVLHVVAQDGVNTADYQVNIIGETPSTDATLANILIDGMAMNQFLPELNPGLQFSPMMNMYTINLASGTTVLPNVSANLKMQGQTLATRIEGMDIYLDVLAEDGLTQNTYALHFMTPMSANADLQMIYLDGQEMAGFDPKTVFYFIDLPVGTKSLPDIFAQKGESHQQVAEPVVEGNQVTINVTAENGTKNAYTLYFTFLLSDADTLTMLYLNGVPMEGFDAHVYYYSETLPVGTMQMPELTWDMADAYQTVTLDTLETTDWTMIQRVNVVAECGKSNAYTVAMNVEKSAVDTLQMIYLNGRELEGFDPYVTEYVYELNSAEEELPTIDYVLGDNYQTVVVENLTNSTRLIVTAASGQTRVYVIRYTMALSSDASLEMILLAGEELTKFDPDVLTYTCTLALGEKQLPNVSVRRRNEMQHVDIQYVADTVRIQVVAEDMVSTNMYKLIFVHEKSSDATLLDILLDEQPLEGFDPLVSEYTITLPFGTTRLPQISILYADFDQEAFISEPEMIDGKQRIIITVTAADGETVNEYILYFVTEKSSDCLLTDLQVFGKTIDGFRSDSTTYTIWWPMGTADSELATDKDVTYTTSSQQATVSVNVEPSTHTIAVIVFAEDGENSMVYEISQKIILSSNCNIAAIYLNEVADENLFAQYDPEDEEGTIYTYYLMEGQLAPRIIPIPEDETAVADTVIGQVGDTCAVTCYAQDGSRKVYYIAFLISDINDSDTPRPTDVLVKPLGGGQVMFATLRKDVHVGLYNGRGQMIRMVDLPSANPNDVEIIQTATGEDKLNNVYSLSSGVVVEFNPSEFYFYVFFEGTRRRIISGKLLLLP